MMNLGTHVRTRQLPLLGLLVAALGMAGMPTHARAVNLVSTPTATPTETPLPCSILFSGLVTDALTGAAIDGAALCLNSGFCAQTDPNGAYSGLCYPGWSSAGTYLCAVAAGYKNACQGPWTPTGSSMVVDFFLEALATVTPTPTNTPTPIPGPEISVTPSTFSLGCAGTFEITITNSGAPGTTLQISSLTLANGYSQGDYGTGFSWDLSHITLPASLASGASLAISVTFSAAGQFYPSRLELTCDSNAANSPHVFQVYFGGAQTACSTPTPTPTSVIVDHPTPTATPTPTPTSCVSDPPLVNPVTSPTDLLVQTLTGYSPGLFCPRGGSIEIFGVELLTLTKNCDQGTFEAMIQLQPDHMHEVTVCLRPGLCGTGGCRTVEIVQTSSLPTATPTATATPTPPTACVGDCDHSGAVTVAELVTMVNIALSQADVATCSIGDADQDGQVTIDEIITAVNYALNECPVPQPGFRINGHVAEFPGCMGHMRGIGVVLNPLGLRTETLIGPDPVVAGTFSFEDVPPGEYTLAIDPRCNPYGCWPPTAVRVVGGDVSVQICNVAS